MMSISRIFESLGLLSGWVAEAWAQGGILHQEKDIFSIHNGTIPNGMAIWSM